MLDEYYKKFHSNKYITKFGNLVDAHNLWRFDRESVAKAMALGVACSWIPLPFHTVFAVLVAVLLDCNIPLVASSIWFANPLTIPFMYYFAYDLGVTLLNIPPAAETFQLNFADILIIFQHIWQPFLLGCLVAGIIFGILFYFLTSLLWPVIDELF